MRFEKKSCMINLKVQQVMAAFYTSAFNVMQVVMIVKWLSCDTKFPVGCKHIILLHLFLLS